VVPPLDPVEPEPEPTAEATVETAAEPEAGPEAGPEAVPKAGPNAPPEADGEPSSPDGEPASPDGEPASPDGEPPSPDGSARQPTKRRGLRALLPAPIWQIGRLLLLALIIEYVVLPQLAGPRKLVHVITEVNPLLLLAGAVLEAASLIAYAEFCRSVLPREGKLSLFTVLRIQMTTLSVSHAAPGGSATGSALGYRFFTQAGIPGSDVGFALAMVGIGSAVVLNVIFWIALIVSIPVWGFSGVYLIAAAVGVVLLLATLGLVFFFTRGEERVGAALERLAARIPFVDGAALRRYFVQVAGRLQELGRQRRLVGRAVLWAGANWILDAASLWVFVGAFGSWVNPDGLLVAYGLANVLAAIPITPGGLGVIEATLTSVLVGFGTTRAVATLGVICYRLINFWLPIPLGGLTYLSLQVDRARPNRGGTGWFRFMGHRVGGHVEQIWSKLRHKPAR
jgi:uncharacterized protein (TIRG00374 family)